MDKDLILPMVINQSRRKIARQAGQYYEFSESELLRFVEEIVEQCASIADSNRDRYVFFAEALGGLVLPDTGDLIRHHFGILSDFGVEE